MSGAIGWGYLAARKLTGHQGMSMGTQVPGRIERASTALLVRRSLAFSRSAERRREAAIRDAGGFLSGGGE